MHKQCNGICYNMTKVYSILIQIQIIENSNLIKCNTVEHYGVWFWC